MNKVVYFAKLLHCVYRLHITKTEGDQGQIPVEYHM